MFLGNPDGTFQTQMRFDAGFGSDSVVITDVNGDGIQDIVTANRVNNDFSVLLGNGTGCRNALFQVRVRLQWQ